jgi:hypothetical protein
LENLKERDQSEDIGIDRGQYQKGALENRVGRCGLDASGLG